MQPLSRHDKVYCARAKPGEEVEPTRGDRELKRDPRIDLAAANPVVGVWVEIVHKIENRAARKSIVNHLFDIKLMELLHVSRFSRDIGTSHMLYK